MASNTTQKTKNLMAVSELKRRRREIDDRLAYLEKEQRTLDEIHRSLTEEAEHLADRIAAANRERQQMTHKMDTRTQNAMRVVEEMERLKREAAVFEKRCAENEARVRELDEQIAALEGGLSAAKHDMMSVTEELESGRATIVRMNRKLQLTSGNSR